MILVRLTALAFALALIQSSLAEEAKKLNGYGYNSGYGTNYPTNSYGSNYGSNTYGSNTYGSNSYGSNSYGSNSYKPSATYTQTPYNGVSNYYDSYKITVNSLKYWYAIAFGEHRYFPVFTICEDTNTALIPGTCFHVVKSNQKKTLAVCPYYTTFKCNQCANSPCLNGGACATSASNNVMCSCPYGFSGDRCQTVMTKCTANPCTGQGFCFGTGLSNIKPNMCAMLCICGNDVTINKKYVTDAEKSVEAITTKAYYVESQVDFNTFSLMNAKLCQELLVTDPAKKAWAAETVFSDIYCPTNYEYSIYASTENTATYTVTAKETTTGVKSTISKMVGTTALTAANLPDFFNSIEHSV